MVFYSMVSRSRLHACGDKIRGKDGKRDLTGAYTGIVIKRKKFKERFSELAHSFRTVITCRGVKGIKTFGSGENKPYSAFWRPCHPTPSEQILDNRVLISDNTIYSRYREQAVLSMQEHDKGSAFCTFISIEEYDLPPEYLDFEKPIADLEKKIEELTLFTSSGSIDLEEEILKLHKKADQLRAEIYSRLTPWQKAQISRHPNRPYTLEYIEAMLTDFMEMHGDRSFADDPAIVCGMAKLDGMPVVVIGHQKGRTTKEKIQRNFGMPNPEGYRKALRMMRFAEKFRKPLITFIDTPGAYPGIGAEERGQGESIAQNLYVMSGLKVPIVTVVIGEGGSGGALALGIADRVLMLEHSTYSVISPEGCAAILWNNGAKANEAADLLKITAQDLFQMKVIDEVVEEPIGGAHRDPRRAAELLKEAVTRNLVEIKNVPPGELVRLRYEKFRTLGMFDQI
jgi:acetyl-CoA carboxylase carboxyl transferase subunit alpha